MDWKTTFFVPKQLNNSSELEEILLQINESSEAAAAQLVDVITFAKDGTIGLANLQVAPAS
ncbi:hypothetical protein HYC85_020910 [Camellia sinensis]|uniref:Uncharacterized protein n=1 Tax=Camellia sinensis TaxID=4442 RepID=A0A7J7GV29_CAMSI|nr:hypothetical protein HYC85_020910 [Camellia sinensis]